ncbi:MAG: glutathione S-transferase [Lautropia sp.]
MIVVHHLNNSRSQRVLWLLEELGLEYRIERYQRDPRTMLAPPELRRVHPLGKSPVIVDGDITLAESGAILEYLTQRHGGGRLLPPEGSPERIRCSYWMHYAEGSAMPPLLMRLVLSRLPQGPMPFFVRPIARKLCDGAMKAFVEPNLRTHFDYIEGELSRQRWFAGPEFTVADIQMSFPMEAAAARAGLDQSRPRSMAFLEAIHARPAYRRAIEKGGPYELLK